MRLKAGLYSLAYALVSTSALAADKPTIASTSLCGDAYLLATSADDQIAALSWQSRSSLSLANDSQRALPQTSANAEVLIKLAPDIVLFGPGEGYKIEPILKAAEIEIIRLDWTETFEGVVDNLGKLGEVYVPPGYRPPSRKTPKILYLSRSGGSAGTYTFINAVITHAGGRNIWEQSGWFTPDPETLATLKPDLIVTSYFIDGYESAQAKSLTNGVHQRLLETVPTVDIPGKYWPCANPQLFKVSELIREGIETWHATR